MAEQDIPVLVHEEAGTDFTLIEGATGCWITVDGLSVHIIRTDEGVVADIYTKGGEDDAPIAGTWAHFNEAN